MSLCPGGAIFTGDLEPASLDVLVAEVALQRTGVQAVVRELEVAGVPEHVRVDGVRFSTPMMVLGAGRFTANENSQLTAQPIFGGPVENGES